ncbi:MAG: hypothetical protein EOO96_21075, partial [Pedobacter sp.]
VLRQPAVTSVLVGASSAAQLSDSLKSLDNLLFNETELKQIEDILE